MTSLGVSAPAIAGSPCRTAAGTAALIPGVTMKAAPALATRSTSAAVRTVPAPISVPGRAWARAWLMTSAAPGVVSDTSISRTPASARVRTAARLAASLVPRTMASSPPDASSAARSISSSVGLSGRPRPARPRCA